MTRRIFVQPDLLPIISGKDVHHLCDVLRMKVGDRLELLDGLGTIYQAEIRTINKKTISCTLLSSQKAESEPLVKVTLAQALPKGRKMDFIIEKCTEMGIEQIIPVLTERSIAKTDKTERWQTIAKEAAEQSGRAIIPTIAPLATFQDILRQAAKFDLAIIPWEIEQTTTLKKVLKETLPTSILVLVGPEGGFSAQEVEQAQKYNFRSITLGKRILRSETAGLATLAAIIYELG